jgi:hypothetical protein
MDEAREYSDHCLWGPSRGHLGGKGLRIWDKKEVALRSFERAYAISETIPGWLMPNEAEYLYELGYEASSKNIIEIGTYFGKSTYLMAQGIRDAGSGTLLITIDVHYRGTDQETRRPVIFAEDAPLSLLRMIRQCELDSVIVPMLGWSDICLSTLDFSAMGAVFIDGGHEFEDVERDYKAVRARIPPDSSLKLLFHDYHPEFPGVVRAVEECVKTEPGYRYVDQVHSLFVCFVGASGEDVKAHGNGQGAHNAMREVAAHRRRFEMVAAENRMLRQQLAQEDAERASWRQQAEELRSSTSWKATAPMRWAMDRLRGRRRGA